MLNSRNRCNKTHSENSFLRSDIRSVNKLNYFMLQEREMVSVVKMVYKAATFQLAPGRQVRYANECLTLSKIMKTVRYFKLDSKYHI